MTSAQSRLTISLIAGRNAHDDVLVAGMLDEYIEARLDLWKWK